MRVIFVGYYSESLEQDITVSIKGIKFPINSNPEPCTKHRPCPIEGIDASFSAALEVPELVPVSRILIYKTIIIVVNRKLSLSKSVFGKPNVPLLSHIVLIMHI